MHSSETWSIAALREGREDLLVLAPFLAERRLPVDVRLDAVAVADVHRGLALQPLRGALERRHAPLRRLGHVDVERRLVELDDVDAVGLERERFLVEQLGEGECHLDPARLAVAVVAVGNGVDDRHRAGQGELEQPAGVGAGEARLGRVDAAAQAQGADHLRHHRVVAVVADPHLHLVLEVDAFDLGEEAVHEVLARLLAVADGREARVLLHLQPEQRGIGLGALELGAAGLPLGPELLGLGKPGGLGQAAGDGGTKHRSAPGCRVAPTGGAPRLLPSARERRSRIRRRRGEAPLPAAERIAALDVLRGVALFGIFIMNMPGFTHSVFTPPPVDASGSTSSSTRCANCSSPASST